MEATCNRCHQVVPAASCFCPACGLPQLVYSVEESEGQGTAERWTAAVRDASTIDWKPALRCAAAFGIPAGLVCCGYIPLGILGYILMAAAAAWAVTAYVRSQRPAWITAGAGARIGLVTGLLAAWLAFAAAGGALFAQRFGMHQAAQIDAEWQSRVKLTQSISTQMAAQMGSADQAKAEAQGKWMMSPWGHAGFEVFGFAANSFFLLIFAIAGGAAGARFLARTRRPSA